MGHPVKTKKLPSANISNEMLLCPILTNFVCVFFKICNLQYSRVGFVSRH